MTTATTQAFANIAFIKYSDETLGRTNGKGDSVSKDFGGRTFCPGVSPVFSKSLNLQRSKSRFRVHKMATLNSIKLTVRLVLAEK
jgi:hypothetical protein